MSIADLIRRMSELGTPSEAIALAVEAIEIEQNKEAERKRKRAEQKAKERAAKADVARQSHDGRTTVAPQKVNDPLPSSKPLENNLTKNSPPSGVRIAHTREADAPKPAPKISQKAACITALSQVLSPEMADAVWQHRKTKKAELTLKAAELLAGKLAACPDATAAAELMIERGWQSVNVDWVRNAEATGPPGMSRRVQAEQPASDWTRYRENLRARLCDEPEPSDYSGATLDAEIIQTAGTERFCDEAGMREHASNGRIIAEPPLFAGIRR